MSMMNDTAPCMFCGQIRQISAENELTDEQAIEMATMSCDCPEAIAYQKDKKRKEKAMSHISVLFGEEAEARMKIKEDIVEIMMAATEQIYDGDLDSITLSIPGGVKAKIGMNAKGGIKVERTDSAKRELIG